MMFGRGAFWACADTVYPPKKDKRQADSEINSFIVLIQLIYFEKALKPQDYLQKANF
jgi:hypothetical protein